jgi:hypothetical protein
VQAAFSAYGGSHFVLSVLPRSGYEDERVVLGAREGYLNLVARTSLVVLHADALVNAVKFDLSGL